MRGLLALLAGLMTLPATAQGPFQIRTQSSAGVSSINSGGTVSLNAAAGQSAETAIIITYTGATSAVVSVPQVFSAGDFTIASTGLAAVSLGPGRSTSFTVAFKPTSAATSYAQLGLSYLETSATAGNAPSAGSIQLILTGTSPDLFVAYSLPSDGNVTAVGSGGNIQLPDTAIGGSTTATITIGNRGGGAGAISALTLAGSSAFQLMNVPAFPQTVAPNGSVQFLVRFNPRQTGSATATLQVGLPGSSLSIPITGLAIASNFRYSLLTAQGITALNLDQPLSIPDTSVGDQTSVTLQVRNSSSVAASVGSISASGAPYTVGDLPPLPQALAPDDIFTFTLTFAPTQPDRTAGKLRIGNDVLTLAGTGLGSRLIYFIGAGAGRTSIAAGGTLLFEPTQVGGSLAMPVTLRNTGTSPASIVIIATSDPKAPFQLSSLPQFPASLKPDAELSFTLTFSPTTTGVLTVPLVINAQQFNVLGAGTAPPPLPDFQITGASGPQQPFLQPAVGLTLSAGYPIAIRGTLAIRVDADPFPQDPAVQFLSGGATVSFTIPANGTQAVFPNGSTRIRLQTGTVASSIVLTPSFLTESGVDLTPAHPATQTLTIAPEPPQLLDVQITSRSDTSMTLAVSGYADTKVLSQLKFVFAGDGKVALPSGGIVVNVANDAALWFSSLTAQAFGGQFQIAAPFTFHASSSSVIATAHLQSVAVTASNDLGTSNSLTINLQ